MTSQAVAVLCSSIAADTVSADCIAGAM